MKKTLFAGLLIFVVTALIAGCGSSKGTSNNDAATSSTSAASKSAAASSEAPQDPVTLKYMYWTNGPADKENWDKLAAAFHKDHPNITFAVEAIDPKAYQQVLKARLAGGEGPDLFGIQPEDLTSLAKGNYLSEVTDQAWFKNLYPDAQKTYMIDGKAVATPMFLAGSGILYNKAIFDKYQLQEPKTYDELIKVSQTLKDNKVIPFAMSAKDSWWPQFILYYATAEHVTAKTPTFNSDVMAGKAKFSENAGWQESMSIYKEMGDKGFYAPNALGVGFDQNKASWLAGETAMMPAVWLLEDSRKANLNLGFFNFPTTNDPNSNYMWGSYGGAVGINAQNKHIAEANVFMDWLFQKPNYMMLLSGLKVFPIEEGIDVSGMDPLFPQMAQAWAPPKVMVGTPNDTWLPGVQEVMITGLQALTAGKMTVPELLQKMDESTAKAIKDKK